MLDQAIMQPMVILQTRTVVQVAAEISAYMLTAWQYPEQATRHVLTCNTHVVSWCCTCFLATCPSGCGGAVAFRVSPVAV